MRLTWKAGGETSEENAQRVILNYQARNKLGPVPSALECFNALHAWGWIVETIAAELRLARLLDSVKTFDDLGMKKQADLFREAIEKLREPASWDEVKTKEYTGRRAAA